MLNYGLSNTTFEPPNDAFTHKFEVEEITHYGKKMFYN
jgi:hypothetical protein